MPLVLAAGPSAQRMEKARGKGRADVAFNLGVHYEEHGDARRARELFEEARSRGHAGAAANLGVLYEEQGDVDRARQCYEEACGKGVVSAAFNLGALYHEQGDMDRARQCYEEARGKGDVASRNEEAEGETLRLRLPTRESRARAGPVMDSRDGQPETA